MSADKKYVSKENLAAFAEALAAQVPLKSDIPTKVSDLQNDLGFTDKPGTITSVTLNGTTTSSGGVDLGYLVVQEGGKGLSSNDYTSLEKSKLSGIESGAQVNTIETIKVNDTVIEPDANKAVNVEVPTALSDLSEDATHRLVSDTEKTTWSGKQNALTFDTVPTENSTNPVTSGGLYTVITQNEYVTAEALNDLDDRVSDLEDSVGDITIPTKVSDLQNDSGFTSNTGTLTGVSFNGDPATVTNGVASIIATIPDVSDYFDDVVYDSQTKRINFKNGDSVLTYIDATDFIKDGMVDDVELSTPSVGSNSGVLCLIITFNTDAGLENIEVPVSSIFDPSIYYTKTEIEGREAWVSGTGISSAILKGTSNSTASGSYSVAEGSFTTASSQNAHAEGYNTVASGDHSHAEGYRTRAVGQYSHAEGYYTRTSNDGEHAEGRYNRVVGGAIHTTGIGTSDINRRNAFEVWLDGKVFLYDINGFNGANSSASTSIQNFLDTTPLSSSEYNIIFHDYQDPDFNYIYFDDFPEGEFELADAADEAGFDDAEEYIEYLCNNITEDPSDIFGVNCFKYTGEIFEYNNTTYWLFIHWNPAENTEFTSPYDSQDQTMYILVETNKTLAGLTAQSLESDITNETVPYYAVLGSDSTVYKLGADSNDVLVAVR